jgi:hypothetical protein
MNLLARCCEQGWGTAVDLQAASDWYRRSAEGGYFRGQYNWATLLLRAGRVREAAEWLTRAADGGNESVRRAATRILNLLAAARNQREPLSGAM